jgi:fructose-1-phosphate kinase PfkB-like protein
MVCGSAPPGTPVDFYARLIHLARRRQVKTLLDTDGDVLMPAIEEAPTVFTPNQQEAERLLNRALITRTHFFEAVERIRAMGAESVILSLGSRGAVAIDTDGRMCEAVAPRVEVLCPIGAGDALCAAYIWAAAEGREFTESVRWGVAAGTASAQQPGVTFADVNETRKIFERVEVRTRG